MTDSHPMEWPNSACQAVDERDEKIEQQTAENERLNALLTECGNVADAALKKYRARSDF